MMRLLIDTDAGIDDAEALMMALAYPSAEVVAVTTVNGNVGLYNVNRNVASVLQVMNMQHVPVYSGALYPLVEPWEGATEFHMQDGLGDWDERPECAPVLQDEPAATALIRLARENPGELTLVALGPLTNIALAIRLDPDFVRNIKQFVFMGGAYHAVGNTRRMTVEFNIGADPEAAYIALSNFPHATMVSWEATLEHPIPWADFDALCALETSRAQFFRGITHKVTEKWRAIPYEPGHLLPDPLAMAVALEPELILAQEERYVTVELNGLHSRGQTVVNYTLEKHGPPNVKVVRKIDVAGVIRLFQQMLQD